MTAHDPLGQSSAMSIHGWVAEKRRSPRSTRTARRSYGHTHTGYVICTNLHIYSLIYSRTPYLIGHTKEFRQVFTRQGSLVRTQYRPPIQCFIEHLIFPASVAGQKQKRVGNHANPFNFISDVKWITFPTRRLIVCVSVYGYVIKPDHDAGKYN